MKIETVKANLTLKQKHFRKYPQLSVGDKVKIYTKELAIIFREKKQTADGVIKSSQQKDRQGYDTTKILFTRGIEKAVFAA